MDNDECTIGVKFGSNCSVGIWRNNKVEIIPNDIGSNTTPSIISFTRKDILIGKTAKNIMNINPKNTIYGINKLIGERFDDPEIQEFIKSIPFKVEKDLNSNKPIIIIEKEDETLKFLPEELYSMILVKLKEDAEKYLNTNIKNIIITVPANFNYNQRESIKNAVELAKLNLIEIMNEPTVACITYGFGELNKENHILVFQMGSSKLNISILNVQNYSFSIKTSVYDEKLGGDSFDNKFVEYCFKKFKEKTKIDINTFDKERRKKIWLKVKNKCERQRIILSTSEYIPFQINDFIDGRCLSLSIERKDFEKICKSLFDGCIKLVEKALETTGLKKNEIDKIIMSGGCSFMPKIQETMKKYFKGKRFYQDINPEEVYTYGATIQSHYQYEIKDNILEILKYLNDIEKSKDFVDKLEVVKVIEKMQLFTKINITKSDLEVVQLNNPEKDKKRKEQIKNIASDLNNNKLTNSQYLDNVLILGTDIKDNIIYDMYHNPEKFVSKKEIEAAKEDSTLFIQGALLAFLNQNNITAVIEKDSQNLQTSHTTLQLISNGEAFRKVIDVSITYGDIKDALILSDESEKDNFIKMKKKEYSLAIGIPEEEIIISNVRSGLGTIIFTIKFLGRDPTEKFLEIIAKDTALRDIKMNCLLKGCTISPSKFDSRGNKSNGWCTVKKRGPPNYLMEYDPPINWKGYGLYVLDQYDNGDNTWLGNSNVEGEWYIAYHGTSGRYASAILEGGYKAGGGQMYANDENINPLNKSIIPICGEGVYCSPLIRIADEYSGSKEGYKSSNLLDFNNKKYQFVFMNRVNPYKVRISKEKKIYWIVSGDKLNDKSNQSHKYDDEIRPYRILLKEFKEDNHIICVYDIKKGKDDNDDFLNNKIKIFNSYEEIKRDFPQWELEGAIKNEDEMKAKGELYLNDKKIDFGFKYIFPKEGKYTFKILFTKPLSNVNLMFRECKKLISIDFSEFTSDQVTNMSYMFYSCSSLTSIKNISAKKVTNMSRMFYYCSSLVDLYLSYSFKTSYVTDMSEMFYFCSSLTSLNLSNFITKKVTNMSHMFSSCSSLITLDLSNFQTENVTDMSDMFDKCSSLKNITFSSKFTTNNVKDMSYMFSYCKSLTKLDLSNFNTDNVINMSYMFTFCTSLESLDLSNFNSNDNTDIKYIFNSVDKNKCKIVCKDDKLLKEFEK